MMEALISFVRRQIGLRTDSASASGSLHAKVGDLKNFTSSLQTTVLNSLQKPRGPAGAAGSFMTTSTEFVTVLDIAGKGRLVGLFLHQTTKNNPSVIVTVDGHVLANGASSLDVGGYSYPAKDYYFYSQGFTNDGDPRNAEINFKASLKLQLKTLGGQATLRWLYELE